MAALHFRDQRREEISLRHLAMLIGEFRSHESLIEIPVQNRAHALRQNQRGQKILIEPLAADQVEMFFADANRAHGKQTEFNTILQVHAAEERALRIPIFLGGARIFKKKNTRSPLADRNKHPLI